MALLIYRITLFSLWDQATTTQRMVSMRLSLRDWAGTDKERNGLAISKKDR